MVREAPVRLPGQHQQEVVGQDLGAGPRVIQETLVKELLARRRGARTWSTTTA